MSWRINVPHRSRSDSIAEALIDAREIADPAERAVTRNVLAGFVGSAETVGDVLDHLEQAGPRNRRQVLDRARSEAGLPSTGDVDEREKFEQAQAAARRRGRRPLPECARPDCAARPTGPGGIPEEVHVSKWWCAHHEHLAQPGDLDPPPLPIDFATMSPIDPDEAARAQLEAELLQQQQQVRNEERVAYAREAREVARLREERFQSEIFGGQG